MNQGTSTLFICATLSALAVFVAGDTISDTNARIGAQMNNTIQAVQNAIKNAPPGSVGSASCTSDSNGNTNCVKNVQIDNGVVTSNTGSGTNNASPVVPAVDVKTQGPVVSASAAPAVVSVTTAGNGQTVLLASSLLTVSLALFARSFGVFA